MNVLFNSFSILYFDYFIEIMYTKFEIYEKIPSIDSNVFYARYK